MVGPFGWHRWVGLLPYVAARAASAAAAELGFQWFRQRRRWRVGGDPAAWVLPHGRIPMTIDDLAFEMW
jgi:hypothetical protein